MKNPLRFFRKSVDCWKSNEQMKYTLRFEKPAERFERLEFAYRNHYKRTTGKDAGLIEYKRGYVSVLGMKVRLNAFDDMVETLKKRATYKE